MLLGADVSYHNGYVNWSKFGGDFAIIRMGFGDDLEKQDDKKFMDNVNGCIANNIPFGLYLYSYADSDTHLESEIYHTQRLLQRLSEKPFCVYIDMEENNTIFLGKRHLTAFALKFCNAISAKGYKAGVYANQNWFKNYLDAAEIANRGYSLWVARYSAFKPDIGVDYDIWQYTSGGRIEGVNGSVDLNYMYGDLFIPQEKSTTITYQVWSDINDSWLPNVINDFDYAGIPTHDVCCVYANANKGNVTYLVHYKGGRWLPAVKNREDYAGIYNKPIDGFAITYDRGKIEYRAHLRESGRWLPWVSGYDINDHEYGYAGILGHEIDLLQIRPISG